MLWIYWVCFLDLNGYVSTLYFFTLFSIKDGHKSKKIFPNSIEFVVDKILHLLFCFSIYKNWHSLLLSEQYLVSKTRKLEIMLMNN